MLESYPSFYWVLGRFVAPLAKIREEMTTEIQIDLVTSARQGLEMLLRQDGVEEMLPRSTQKAGAQLAIVNGWMKILAGTSLPGSWGDYSTLRRGIEGFMVTLQDELDRLAVFTVTPKGNLDIHRLVEGISKAYEKQCLELIDQFTVEEIDHAGKCLAFELPTSCGFHILRSVENGMKAYIYAATGTLPKLTQRNWGAYIRILRDEVRASANLIDIITVLRTKRNPLMHPTDNLTENEAIALMCLCQSGLEVLTGDVRRKKLEMEFKESLEKILAVDEEKD